MTRWSSRISLIAFFLFLAILMVEKDTANFKPQVRTSRYRDSSWLPEIRYPHVGPLREHRLNSTQQGISSPLGWLNFDKKINTYLFTFYNWYFFQISFVDLSYDSYVEFKVFVEDQLHDRWIVRTGFNLDESFYPNGGSVRAEGEKCCRGCARERGMNFNIRTNTFNLTARQQTIRNSSGARHDGYQYGRFWYYTPNHTLDDPENEAFKSDKTVTTFNITYESRDRKVEANLTHVLRHNQCFSFLDEENEGTFRHNCVGGYASGRLFLNRKVKHAELETSGRFVNSAYNLDNNRTRAAFHGLRSTRSLNGKLGSFLPKTNWKWKGFTAFMQCFSKPEYYSKHEKIEKERYVGLHFGRPLEKGRVENFQDFLFYNGKMVPVHRLDYSFSEKYKRHTNVTFRSAPSEDLWQPEFEINFTILSKEHHEESDWLGRKNELRAYGFWSGWIDEGKKGQKVDFFNISGYIETKNSVY